VHNTQPSRVEVDADRVRVSVDATRALTVVDPDGRQRLISCGAAVLNIRLAMLGGGHDPVTTLLPDPAAPAHLATVVAGAFRARSPQERTMLAMIERRRTNRGPYQPVPVPAPVLRRLADAAAAESAVLRLVEPPQRAAVSELVRRGIDAQAASARYRAEFLRWTRDDIAPQVGTPRRSWRAMPFPLPALRGRDRLSAPDRTALHDMLAGATLGVLGTDGDDPRDWLVAGQALQRLLLTATAAGVAVAFLNQPTEVPDLRTKLAAVLGAGLVPQLVLRLGYGSQPAPRTGRRAVD
jgi:hypothetical protein